MSFLIAIILICLTLTGKHIIICWKNSTDTEKGLVILEKFTVLVVGSGKLAEEILRGIEGPSISQVVRWDERISQMDNVFFVIHAGSGRELDHIIKFCSGTGSVLLELSTGESTFPSDVSFPVVICPNVNMQMLYFMAMVKYSSKFWKGSDIRISESHQASKTTKPGTAVYLAKSLGVPENSIRSERNPETQKEVLGIPSLFLDRHAYHEIVIKDPEVEIRLETRVLGKSAYAVGLAKVIDIVARRKPEPGYHDIVDLAMDDVRNSF